MSALTFRMLPLGVTGGVITAFAGSPNPADPSRRYYTAGPGGTIDCTDGDQGVLVSQGFGAVAPSGTTALRNSLIGYFKASQMFLDLSLGRVLMHDGNVWRDVVTGNAV
jgi:hypothetical protein